MGPCETYTVVGIIDSSLAGKDAGEELGEEKSGIPIFANLKDALSKLPAVPDGYIYGKAPFGAYISAAGISTQFVLLRTPLKSNL